MNGFFWKSKKHGQDGEKILFLRIKDNKNQKRYVSKTLSEFSEIQNKYVELLSNDLLKHSLKINLEFFYKRINESKLDKEEIDYLRNALHTRYMKKIRLLEIPLNSSDPKRR